jgi:hypothetical protein
MTASRTTANETFNHPVTGGLSDKLVLHQLQQRHRQAEEEKIFGKMKVRDIVR